MTLLKFVNVVFFQWFYVRLTKCQKEEWYDYKVNGEPAFPGTIPPGTGQISYRYKTITWYSIQCWVIPLTGWWGPMLYVGKKPEFLRLTKKKSLKTPTQ